VDSFLRVASKVPSWGLGASERGVLVVARVAPAAGLALTGTWRRSRRPSCGRTWPPVSNTGNSPRCTFRRPAPDLAHLEKERRPRGSGEPTKTGPSVPDSPSMSRRLRFAASARLWTTPVKTGLQSAGGKKKRIQKIKTYRRRHKLGAEHLLSHFYLK
jgi:hypothetical protein